MSVPAVHTIQQCLDRLRSGDPTAQSDLLSVSRQRLLLMTRKMLHGFRRVHRWEDTDDVVQNVLMRLDRSLVEMSLSTSREFLAHAAAQIRRELIDLARHYFGPEGMGTKHATPRGAEVDAASPDSSGQHGRIDWAVFHEQAAKLPEKEREVFDLLWYHGLSQTEASDLLGVDARTVRRWWQSARLLMAAILKTDPFAEF